jgi:hypothetical protein
MNIETHAVGQVGMQPSLNVETHAARQVEMQPSINAEAHATRQISMQPSINVETHAARQVNMQPAMNAGMRLVGKIGHAIGKGEDHDLHLNKELSPTFDHPNRATGFGKHAKPPQLYN